MTDKTLILCFLCVLMLAACGKKPDEPAAPGNAPNTYPRSYPAD